MSTLPSQPLSPLDGRYHSVVAPIGEHLSEAGLNRARVEVEVEWLIVLTDQFARLGDVTPAIDEVGARVRGLMKIDVS